MCFSGGLQREIAMYSSSRNTVQNCVARPMLKMVLLSSKDLITERRNMKLLNTNITLYTFRMWKMKTFIYFLL